MRGGLIVLVNLRGGRNLLLDSTNILMTGSDGGNNRNVAEKKNGYVSIMPVSTGNVYINPIVSTSLKMEKGKTYTLSFRISTHHEVGLYWYPSEKYVRSGYIPNTNGQWVDIEFTYTQTDSTSDNPALWGFFQLQPGEEIKYSHPKLEVGSKATSWTPAPEDLGLEYPDHVTHFGTYFKNEDMISDELVEFPEELRGRRNYFTIDSVGTYSPYMDILSYTDNSILFKYKNGYVTVRQYRGYNLEENVIYTISGYLKVNEKIPDKNPFTGDYASTYGRNTSGYTYNSNTGFFSVTQETYGSVHWILHTPTNMKENDILEIKYLKLEKSSSATPWTPSPEGLGLVYPDHITHFGTYFKESNVLGYDLIGGRNLILNSHQEKTSSREYVLYDNLTPIFDKYGLGEYTFSFDVKGAIAGSISVYYSDRTTSQIKYGWRGAGNVNATTEYQRFSFTVDVFELTPDANQSSLAFYGTYDSGRIPSIKNVKIERGSVATLWTPAPEDLGLEYPPSVTYFDKNPVVGSTVTNELVEFDKESKGLDLRNKTDKISGEEVFTDKADNSVVNVEVDGVTIGGDGSSKNLSPDLHYWNTGNGATVGVNTATIPVGGSITLVIPWDGSTGQVRVGYDVVSGSSILVNFTYLGADKTTYIMDVNNLGSGNGYTHALTPGTRGTSYGYYTIDDKVKYVRVNISGSPSYVSEPFTIKNISVKSEGYEYEPPVPYPEHPSHIHSLNDFDVVSSVDGRNYFVIKDLTPKPYPLVGNDHEYTYSLKPNTTYIIRTWNTKGASFRVNGLTVSYSTTGDKGYKVTTDSSGVLRIGLYASAGETDQFIDGSAKLKLEEGSIATDWTPAPEDITEDTNHPLIDKINLLLSEPLRSVGDVKDRLFRDSGGIWKAERNVGEYTTDGTDVWAMGASSGGWKVDGDTRAFYSSSLLNKMNPARTKNAMTDRFTVGNYTTGIVSSDSEGFSLGYASFGVIFRINKNRLSTENSAGFTGWLADSPVTIIYELANPIIETLDQELQDKLNNLRSFKDSNYIYTINNTEGVLEDVKPTLHTKFKSEDYGELAKDGLVYPDDITHLTTQVKYGTMVVSELIEGGGAYGNSTTRV